MTTSVLFRSGAVVPGPDNQADGDPAYFPDLHLDQVQAELNRHCEVDLTGWFQRGLSNVEDIGFRQAVFADLQRETALTTHLEEFVQAMHQLRGYLLTVTKRRNRHESDGWFLHAVMHYLRTVDQLHSCLTEANLDSPGLRAVRDHLDGYSQSVQLGQLRTDSERVERLLAEVRYAVRIMGSRVTVTLDDVPTGDFSSRVDRVFARLAQQETRSRLVVYPSDHGLSSVETSILDRVARLCPDTFAELSAFAIKHAGFADETLTRFDSEIQFYLAYLAVMTGLGRRGARFTLPDLVVSAKTALDDFGSEAFDLALAIAGDHKQDLVSNDFAWHGAERTLVVSGPNQGGKTTFARSIGQIYHVAALGCPVPAARARLMVIDGIHTHFERMEEHTDVGGKLEDDLRRIHHVLERVTARSLVIVNEMFTSTTLSDAEFLGREIIDRLRNIGTRLVYVTFIDDLARLGPHTVSMVSMTAEDDPARRTFQVLRRAPGGKVYAQAIARRYHLSHELITEEVLR